MKLYGSSFELEKAAFGQSRRKFCIEKPLDTEDLASVLIYNFLTQVKSYDLINLGLRESQVLVSPNSKTTPRKAI
jgi:hypothetical protein